MSVFTALTRASDTHSTKGLLPHQRCLPSLTGGRHHIRTDDSHSLKVAAGGYLRIFNIAFMTTCRKVNHATDDYLSLNTELLMIQG